MGDSLQPVKLAAARDLGFEVGHVLQRFFVPVDRARAGGAGPGEDLLVETADALRLGLVKHPGHRYVRSGLAGGLDERVGRLLDELRVYLRERLHPFHGLL